MKTVVLIICDNGLYCDGNKTINSIKYFHPEFKIIRYNTKDINRFREKFNEKWLGLIAPEIMLEVWCSEKPDLLIKIGADCLILDSLNEIIKENYDVASARNDPDQVNDERDESFNRPDVIKNIKNSEWINADLICVKNEKVLYDYVELTRAYRNKIIRPLSDREWADDQYALNVVFKIYGYKSLILDPKNSKLIYGASGNWNHGKTNWDSWKDIDFINNKFIMKDGGRGTGDREIKILHCCGGTNPDKLNYNLFNDETRKHITRITGFHE